MSLIKMLQVVKKYKLQITNYKLQTKWPTNYTNYRELEQPPIKSFYRVQGRFFQKESLVAEGKRNENLFENQ